MVLESLAPLLSPKLPFHLDFSELLYSLLAFSR